MQSVAIDRSASDGSYIEPSALARQPDTYAAWIDAPGVNIGECAQQRGCHGDVEARLIGGVDRSSAALISKPVEAVRAWIQAMISS